MKDSIALRKAWEEHPRYRYRGCAPDADDPTRAAGNLDLTLDAWSGADRDGSEPQKEREARQAAAVDVCFGCAVMVQCDAYATSVTWVNGVPRLAEPDGVWGGRLALERHRMLIESRPETKAAPDRVLRTPQKRAVLQALAGCWDPFEVAAEASRLLVAWGEAPVDVRTANWQRSSIVTKLGLAKDASRMRALAVARERGLLEGVSLVDDGGSVPAVAPPTKLPAPAEPVAVAELGLMPVEAAPGRVCRRVGSRRRRVTAVPAGQLSFDDALAPVVSLFRTVPLGAAA